MVVPPGWNVTEPIGVGIKLFEIAGKLKDAPRSAKNFKLRLEGLGASLTGLDKVLQNIGKGGGNLHPAEDYAQLSKEVAGLQGCINRCDEFIATYVPLTDDGSKKAAPAARARWVWDEKKAKEYSEQIESHISRILLNLNINSFARAHMTPASAPVDIPKVSSQPRSDTLATLPPYTSPKQDGRQKDWDQQPQTPGDILGVKWEGSIGGSPERPGVDSWLSSSPGTSGVPSQLQASPESGPTAPSKRISRTLNLDASSNSSLDSRPAPLRTPSGTISSLLRSPFISPELRPGDYTERVRQDSVFSTDGFLPGISMQDLKKTSITLERKTRAPSTKPIDKIEIFHGIDTNKRYILLSPPRRWNVRYYLNLPFGRAIIPHVEHPVALEANNAHQVRLERIDFRSEQLPSRRQSRNSERMEGSSPVSSSADSIMSTSSSTSTSSGSKFTKEDRLMLQFGNSEDCKCFQELVFGPDVELQAQIPAWEVTSRYRSRKATESKLPCLRLLRCGRFQYLLFHANTSSEKAYKEFRMTYFILEEPSQTSVRLRVSLTDSANEPGQFMGLTRPIDMEDLKNLEYLLIDFENGNHKAAFLITATFDTFDDDPIIPPFSFESRSSTTTNDSTRSMS